MTLVSGSGIFLINKNTGPTPPPAGIQADWLEDDPLQSSYVLNRPYYTTTRSNLLSLISSNSLRLDAGYFISDAAPGLANNGIIVRATGLNKVSQWAVLLANYSGTIESETCIYNVNANYVSYRADNRGNKVTDSNNTRGCIITFPWGDNRYYGNTIINSNITLSLLPNGIFANNYITDSQVLCNNANRFVGNLIQYAGLVSVGNNGWCDGNILNYTQQFLTGDNATTVGNTANGQGIRITNNNVMAGCTFSGEAEFTNIYSMTNCMMSGAIDIDLSRYNPTSFSHAQYRYNDFSNIEATIDLNNDKSYLDSTMNIAGVVKFMNNNLLQDLNLGPGVSFLVIKTTEPLFIINNIGNINLGNSNTTLTFTNPNDFAVFKWNGSEWLLQYYQLF